MNWRALVLSGVFVAGLSMSLVPQADAKRHRDRYDDRCGEIYERIARDRAKIREIAPTGRHRRALRWFREDLQDASRDLDQCRDRRADSGYDDPYYDRSGYGSYDRSDDDDYYGSYGETDQPFDWKRDWPLLLGGMLLPQQ